MDKTIYWAINLPWTINEPESEFTKEPHSFSRLLPGNMELNAQTYFDKNNTFWTELILFKDGKEICRSNKGKNLIDELTLKHDGIEYCVKFMVPQRTTAYVHQQPVDVSIDCEFCEENITISYEDFCAEHGDPADWNYETIMCPRCGAKLTIENQDWS